MVPIGGPDACAADADAAAEAADASAAAADADAEYAALVATAAVVHANADGVFNDDRYEYESIAQPFLASLGRAALALARDRASGGHA